MKEPQRQQQTLLDDEATLVVSGEETTLVAPRFDDEETLVARPVVPFDAPEREYALPEPIYRRTYAPRRSGMFALVLFSVLVGGVLGGAGLYLYQRQSQDPTATTPPTQPAAPADAAQQAPAPNDEGRQAAPNVEPPAQQTEEPDAAPVREPENVPAAERRAAPSDGGESVTPRRGKKGDRDEEVERHTTPPTGGNVARAAEPVARKVDSIFYRPRRARRGGDADRLRRIFEGSPE
ncbi:MAG: hypothetical protein ACJ754_10795 [Pyrinomonadaceae bacterium]